MHVNRTERGFEQLVHPECVSPQDVSSIAAMSFAVGDYENSHSDPGSSYLWIGKDHHLNREEVAELIAHLQRWLDTGSMVTP